MRSVLRGFRAAIWRVVLISGVLGGIAVGVSALHVASIPEPVIADALTHPVLSVRREADGRLTPLGCVCDRTLRPDEVPQVVRDALVATEDRLFYEHSGVHWPSVGAGIITTSRNAVLSLVDGKPRGARGGSTITQQLAKISLTGSYGGPLRKLPEFFFALRLERLYEKDDILRLYLSRANFGQTRSGPIYGLREAARVYFGHSTPAKLSVEEAAILVGVLNGPSVFHPVRRPKAAATRARHVLARMKAEGVLTGKARDPAEFLPKSVRRPLRHRYVEDLLLSEFRQRVTRGGRTGVLRIVSTIDPIAQYRALQFSADEVRQARGLNVARAALVTIDREGRILAVVGDVDYARSAFNIAVRGERQIASTAKIVTYLAALEEGWKPDSEVWDTPAKLDGFRPRNVDGRYLGRISLDHCLRQSRNVCTVWLAQTIGFDKVADMAGRLGLTDGTERGHNVVLGATESSPVQTSAAFAALTNGGKLVEPQAMAHVIGSFGILLWSEPPASHDLDLAPETIDTMRLLLRQVVTKGTGRKAAFQGADSFGKTGTSQWNRDAWFVGFTTDDVTTAVWVGPPEGGTMRNVAGGGLPAKIYARFNTSLVERFHAMRVGEVLPR